jgi:hypothetical protein
MSISVTLLVCVAIVQARKTTKIGLRMFFILVPFFLYALLLFSFLYTNSLIILSDYEQGSIALEV